MAEGYRKKLVERFWEDRKLTYPHLSVLYDIVNELVRKSNDSTTKQEYMDKMLEYNHVKISHNGVIIKVHIYKADTYFQRNIRQLLSTEIDAKEGTFSVAELDYSIKVWVNDITQLLTDLAVLYYMDIEFKDMLSNTETVLNGL